MSHIQRKRRIEAARLNSNMDADLYGYKWARDNVGHQVRQSIDCMGKPDARVVSETWQR